MQTTFDRVNIVWERLYNSSLKAAITGGVYKVRPINSTLEDVVINAPAVNNFQLQTGLVNVNIHVPNKVQMINGVQDSTQPDSARLNTLAKLAIEILTDQWGEDYNYDVQQQLIFEEPGEHYINIRLDFYSLNI